MFVRQRFFEETVVLTCVSVLPHRCSVLSLFPSRMGCGRKGEGCDGRLVQALRGGASRLEYFSMFFQCVLFRGRRTFLRPVLLVLPHQRPEDPKWESPFSWVFLGFSAEMCSSLGFGRVVLFVSR